jgi:DNA invertase Pin-like site-specific DNA recombinase
MVPAVVSINELAQQDLETFGEFKKDDTVSSISKKALIYARVSSSKQTNDDDDDQDDHYDEGSIDGQIEELKDILQKKGLELAHDPIIDKAQTGTDFDRDGIRKVFKLAQRDEVGYLLVEKIDRIGRSAPETLYFINLLQSKCDVRLITSSGERDVSNIHGLMHTTLLSLMAEVQNSIRTSKAKKERVRSFVNQRKWKAYSPTIPLGYNEDDEWLTPDSEEVTIVRDLFETFNECQTYSETERQINERYGGVLEGHSVKTLLTNSVYIGRPQIPEEWVVDLPYDNVVEDHNLQIIDETTFAQIQTIIEEKEQTHASDDEADDLSDFVEEFDPFSVVLASDPVSLLHDCGKPMVKNGQRNLDGELNAHRYYCPECEEYRNWPKGYEHDRMKLIHLLIDEEVDFLEALHETFSFLKE